jgi:hypothetical protein
MKTLEEQQILEIVNPVVAKWLPFFDDHDCSIDQPKVSSGGEGDSYFAEVEARVWKNNTVFDVFNLMISLQGKTLIELNEIELEANNEFQRIASEIKSADSNLQ